MLREREFRELADLIYARSGIRLGENKEALVSARLGKRMRQLGLEDHSEYLRRVRDDREGGEMVLLLDAISTNVTSFFREGEHFDFARAILSDWLARGQSRFRLWSAACSTGEEPYSLAMTCADIPGMERADLKILATDLSTRVLDAARRGRYPVERLAPVPAAMSQRHLRPAPGGAEVDPALRRMVSFHRLNLAERPYPMQGPMDLVFCRNVMIYFDEAMRAGLLGEFRRLLRPGGYLLVGHSESLAGATGGFRMVRPSIYQKD